MLSPNQVAARDGKLTASRVACLMTGDAVKIHDLWRELIGDPAFVPEDLSGVWAVQLGSHTEALNLDWFERKHGPISKRGDVVTHANGWAACTLDGWSDLHSCPIECKHVGGREDLSTIIARYQPQMHWQMIVTGATQCAISVIEGANEPIVEYIDKDEVYAADLMARAEAFMQHVRDLTPPVVLAPVAAPVKAEKTYDMAGNNVWGANAATWLATKQAKKDCESAEKELKALVPADAVRCFANGIEIRRDRAGRLSIKEKVS
jgi:hypothetical protein